MHSSQSLSGAVSGLALRTGTGAARTRVGRRRRRCRQVLKVHCHFPLRQEFAALVNRQRHQLSAHRHRSTRRTG